jgi:hypothetical protein
MKTPSMAALKATCYLKFHAVVTDAMQFQMTFTVPSMDPSQKLDVMALALSFMTFQHKYLCTITPSEVKIQFTCMLRENPGAGSACRRSGCLMGLSFCILILAIAIALLLIDKEPHLMDSLTWVQRKFSP